MPTITNGKHSETLEKEQRICFNNFKRSALQILATSGSEFVCMYEDLSDGVPAPFEDRSFCVSLETSIEHAFVFANRFSNLCLVFIG